MRNRTYWVDHVLSETSKFQVVQSALGDDVYTITPFGTVMQQGTFQDAAHFNSIEEGLTANEVALNLLINFARQNKWDLEAFVAEDATVHGELRALISALDQSVDKLHSVETGTKTLTNTSKFPFNNSQQTVALTTTRDTSNYVVVTEIQSFDGNVGEVVVSEQLANGFKLAYTGSAPSVTIKYKVIGGFNA